jgi:hypothetical protein
MACNKLAQSQDQEHWYLLKLKILLPKWAWLQCNFATIYKSKIVFQIGHIKYVKHHPTCLLWLLFKVCQSKGPFSQAIILLGNASWKGRLSTVDLLINIACFVKIEVNNIELIQTRSTRRWTKLAIFSWFREC